MPEATFTIRAVKPLKSGETNGRLWTLFEVQADGGRRFTTFDAAWRDCAGQSVTATYEETRNGRYTNQVLGEYAKATRPTVSAPAPVVLDRFAVLSNKLDAVLAEIRAIRAHFA